MQRRSSWPIGTACERRSFASYAGRRLTFGMVGSTSIEPRAEQRACIHCGDRSFERCGPSKVRAPTSSSPKLGRRSRPLGSYAWCSEPAKRPSYRSPCIRTCCGIAPDTSLRMMVTTLARWPTTSASEFAIDGEVHSASARSLCEVLGGLAARKGAGRPPREPRPAPSLTSATTRKGRTSRGQAQLNAKLTNEEGSAGEGRK
jgi:hypothetical protein